MFEKAYHFNQPVDFDTSLVTNMDEMFEEAKRFNQPVNFDTSRVTIMGEMFRMAKVFNQPLSFDVSSVTNFEDMFEGNSLSDANKLLIRCAFSGNLAFSSEYNSSWGPGNCA